MFVTLYSSAVDDGAHNNSPILCLSSNSQYQQWGFIRHWHHLHDFWTLRHCPRLVDDNEEDWHLLPLWFLNITTLPTTRRRWRGGLASITIMISEHYDIDHRSSTATRRISIYYHFDFWTLWHCPPLVVTTRKIGIYFHYDLWTLRHCPPQQDRLPVHSLTLTATRRIIRSRFHWQKGAQQSSMAQLVLGIRHGEYFKLMGYLHVFNRLGDTTISSF